MARRPSDPPYPESRCGGFLFGDEEAAAMSGADLPPGVRMLKEMKTSTHLKPGDKGTKQLLTKYGRSLLCVRYRDFESFGVRVKTVELVESVKPLPRTRRWPDGKMVAVCVAFTEKSLRERLKGAGGRWDPEVKVWRVRYGAIRGDAELEERILPE